MHTVIGQQKNPGQDKKSKAEGGKKEGVSIEKVQKNAWEK